MIVPPDLSSLPLAVRSAEMLIGSIVPCGPGHRSVGWPDSSHVRALTLRPFVPDHPPCAAVLLTAGWVWGGTWREGDICEISTLLRARLPHAPAPNVRVHEYRLSPRETIRVAGVRVTTRARTLYDLLFLPEEEWTQRVKSTCALLAGQTGVSDLSFAADMLPPRRPHVRRAERRLESALEIRR